MQTSVIARNLSRSLSVLAFFIFSLSFSLHAQRPQDPYKATDPYALDFGTRSGVLLDMEGGVSWSRISDEGAKNTLGYNLGLTGTYFFMPYVGFGTGLEFIRRGVKLSGSLYSGEVNYIDIPVFAALHLGAGNFRLGIEPGIYYAIKTKNQFVEVAGSSIEANNYLGLQTQLGLLYGINSSLGLGFSAFAKIPIQNSSIDKVGNISGEKDRIYDWGLNLKLAYFIF